MEKAEKFFERLSNNSVSKTLSWFLVGIFLLLTLVTCITPAQDIFSDAEDAASIMPSMLVILTFLMVSFRVGMYNQYAENQKNRYMVEILRYHPISKKVIWKLKMRTMVTFLAKVMGVGLIVQIVISLIVYKSISWMNFFYIIYFGFVLPIVAEIVFDLLVKKMGEEILY